LPKELRRSLACTNMIENVIGTVRRVCRNVKRWRSASMAMRWTAAAMREGPRYRTQEALDQSDPGPAYAGARGSPPDPQLVGLYRSPPARCVLQAFT
jgi:hypothetical protein